MTMADRIAVMDSGQVLQVGTPSEIYEHPANRFVADFIGETNFIDGTLAALDGERGTVRLADGQSIEAAWSGDAPAPNSPVTVAIRPERISLAAAGPNPDGGAAAPSPNGDLACLPGTVSEVHYLGTDTRYHVDAGGFTLVVRRQNVGTAAERYAVGQRVFATWPTDSATILR